MAANARMVPFGMQRPQACFYVAQTFSSRKLREHHAQKLVPAREGSNPVIAAISADATIEFMTRNEVEQLGKKKTSGVHMPSLWVKSPQKYGSEP
jgi:hypothetical protein